ncbi:CAP domain-containing protein [Neorhodopirellula pilleata]|nr:CAP domain-containing protein [Neorhodopirellula pilleata]
MRRLKAVSSEIIARTNDFRAKNDLESLSEAPDLTKAAAKFAKYMAETDRYGHNADGSTPAARAEAAGYDYCVVRENIAYRTNTGEPTRASLTELFVKGWIDSPGHRENMLAQYVTETGVAVATDDGDTFYAVQLFGRPETRSIEIEIANLSDQTVTLVTESNGNRDEFALQPRMTFKMRRCFPTTIELAGSEKTVNVNESESYTIENGPVLAKQTSDRPSE